MTSHTLTALNMGANECTDRNLWPAPSKTENDGVIQRSQGKDKQPSSRGGSFYHSHVTEPNHNHLHTIWPTWHCCYTTAYCAGQDSYFMFMFRVCNLYLICSNCHLSNRLAVISLKFRLCTQAPNSPYPHVSRTPPYNKASRCQYC